MYVYIQSERSGWYPSPKQENSVYLTGSLWTVGFYTPDGKFNPESDHETPDAAAERVSWLNGNSEKESFSGSWEEYQHFKKTH